MGRKWTLLISLLILLFFLRIPAVASEDFLADYDVQYAIAPNGTAIVTQSITLTNQRSNLYPQKYTITIDSSRVKKVIASDDGGVITPAVIVTDGKTNITLSFNSQNVGLGKKLPFTLRYEQGDIAEKLGSIWEVNIPGVHPDADLGLYQVSLQIPPMFGPNAYLVPLPAGGRNTWTKEQMVQGGISAAYGTEQVFILSLSYYLENNRITTQIQEIALPPDTAYQQVTIEELSPTPKTVVSDTDGNWLARYELSANQKLTINAKVLVRITLDPRPNIREQLVDPTAYLKELKYWEVTDPKILSLAQTYNGPRKIYDFVVATLGYDYERVNQNPLRKGALQALASPQNSVCMEFTDLFVAIARAAGIPAREAVGYAYTTNAKLRPLSLVADVLHAWPEYYDRQREIWIPVDPTWARTTGGVNYFDKLDFNHIVFAIHGIDSSYPYPAGSYRPADKQGKNIQIAFASVAPKRTEADFDVVFDFPNVITAGWKSRGTIIIKNTAGVPLLLEPVVIQTAPFSQTITQNAAQVPPLGSITVPLELPATDYLYRGSVRIALSANGRNFQKTIPVRTAYWLSIPFSIVVLVSFLLIWIITKNNHLWKRSKKP